MIHGAISRSRQLVVLVACLLQLVSCGPARDTSVDVSFTQTPIRVAQRLSTPAPSPRRPGRLATVTTPSVGPSDPAASQTVSSTNPGGTTGSTAPAVEPGRPADAATSGPHQLEADPPGLIGAAGAVAAPTAASASQPVAVAAPSSGAEPASPSSADLTPTLTAIATVPPARATPSVASVAAPAETGPGAPNPPTPVAPNGAVYPGQVAEADGRYVTSSSRSARYYYSVDEKSWARIHAEHRVWFRTVDDLLRAFPGRIAYSGRGPRATPSPTPSHSSTP